MSPFSDETLYIAGPEVFYPNGYPMLDAMRVKAEMHGMKVSLPNDTPLKLDHTDLRKNADIIFKNCADSMNISTAIIADLEFFRGSEPDGGTVFELGMAYARGMRLYCYSRDLRPMKCKHQTAVLAQNTLQDGEGRLLPYAELPFCPCIVGSSKLIQGDFDACIQTLLQDINEERKFRGGQNPPELRACVNPPYVGQAPQTGKEARFDVQNRKPSVYLAGPERYSADAAEIYGRLRGICEKLGFTALTPLDIPAGCVCRNFNDPYADAYQRFDFYRRHVRECDILLANLNDFHGMEPNGDTSFECGMAFQLGKKCFGFMENTSRMRDRIPHFGAERNFKDMCGYEVENFDYPINLMFSSSMPVFEGTFETALGQMARFL